LNRDVKPSEVDSMDRKLVHTIMKLHFAQSEKKKLASEHQEFMNKIIHEEGLAIKTSELNLPK